MVEVGNTGAPNQGCQLHSAGSNCWKDIGGPPSEHCSCKVDEPLWTEAQIEVGN